MHLIAIICNSSGRYGTSETNLENWLTSGLQRVHFLVRGLLVGRSSHAGSEIGLFLDEFAQFNPRQALHQNPTLSSGY